MSDAIKIAKEAPKHIEGLLAEMFAAKAEDNRICLGGVYSGQQYIQIQLVVTSNPAELMDDANSEEDEAEAEEERALARQELADHINKLFSRGLYENANLTMNGAHDEAEALHAGDAYFMREGIDNIGGILERLAEYATSPDGVDMAGSVEVFSDTPEIAARLYSLAVELDSAVCTELAERLLALYALLLEINRLEVQA